MQKRILNYLFIVLLYFLSLPIFPEEICEFYDDGRKRCAKISECFINKNVNERKLYHHGFEEWGGGHGLASMLHEDGGYWYLNQVPKSHRFLLQPKDKIYKIDTCTPLKEIVIKSNISYDVRKNIFSKINFLVFFLQYLKSGITTIELERLVNGKYVPIKIDVQKFNCCDFDYQLSIRENYWQQKQKRIANRNILRKIFFFWEWGDYF